MKSALYHFYSLVEEYQETHSFAVLTGSFSDTSQLVNNYRTRARSMR